MFLIDSTVISVLIAWVLIAAISAAIGSVKNRAIFGLFLGLFLGLIGLLITCFVPGERKVKAQVAAGDGTVTVESWADNPDASLTTQWAIGLLVLIAFGSAMWALTMMPGSVMDDAAAAAFTPVQYADGWSMADADSHAPIERAIHACTNLSAAFETLHHQGLMTGRETRNVLGIIAAMTVAQCEDAQPHPTVDRYMRRAAYRAKHAR